MWPDALSSSEPRSGVDALTYGLATLVMREDLFENAILHRGDPDHAVCHNYSCAKCGTINHVRKTSQPPRSRRRLRRGNHFSQFIKKFSLGNGPADWVQEYLVTKESGKMLGTLVALSLARMPNLESFVWDMPTGILRDIWISLSSLGDYEPSRLFRVWVRFHDNKTASREAGLLDPIPMGHENVMLPFSSIPLVSMPSYHKLDFTGHPTETPNFSTLPPLRSLTVLAIDELAYLEELSVLLGRSRDTLRELRISLAPKINTSGYDDLSPIVQLFAAGTESALLFNVLHDDFDPRSDNYIYKPKPLEMKSLPAQTADEKQSTFAPALETSPVSHTIISNDTDSEARIGLMTESESTFGLSESLSPASFSPEVPVNYESIDPALPHAPCVPAGALGPSSEVPHNSEFPAVPLPAFASLTTPETFDVPEDTRSAVLSNGFPTRLPVDSEAKGSKLRLETLELEGCLLNVFVLAQSIDFSILTSLTLLHCEAADILWAQLSRQYTKPASKQDTLVVKNPNEPSRQSTIQQPLRRRSTIEALTKEPKCRLSLKRIHTDAVSTSLINFLSKILAADSLEWLFLQDNPSFLSPVTIDAIYKGPLRRHRASLTKVMVDTMQGASGTQSRSTNSLKWMFRRELLTFVTSGKMSKLRELAMVVEYKDWHFFLQRLPSIPHLRSLYVPYIANHVYGAGLNTRELAMGVVDVVTLRPEVELCYLGIATKCYEIREKKYSTSKRSKNGTTTGNLSTLTEDMEDDSGDNDFHHEGAHDEHDDDDDDDDDAAADVTAPIPASPPTATTTTTNNNGDDGEEEQAGWADDPDIDNASSSEEDETKPPTVEVKYKLREILFYDDKVSIFKARHGHL